MWRLRSGLAIIFAVASTGSIFGQATAGDRLRVVVLSGTLDPESGAPLAGFGGAVINDHGDIAFEANHGVWSTVGGLHRVAQENRAMVGGIDWGYLTNMDLLNSGELIGTCVQHHHGSDADRRAVWRSRGGPAEVIVNSGDDAGIPPGYFDNLFLGADLAGGDGTYYFNAYRRDINGERLTTFTDPFVVRKLPAGHRVSDIYTAPDLPGDYRVGGYDSTPLPIRVLPGGVLEHIAARTVWTGSPFPGVREPAGERVSVWHSDPDGPVLQRELPLAAPGVGPNMVFGNVVSVRMNDRGWMIIDAYAEQPDGTGAVRGVWAETPDGLELVHIQTEENFLNYGFVHGHQVVLSDNGVWAFEAGLGGKRRVHLRTGAGMEQIMMREDAGAAGLPDDVTIDRILNYAMSPTGELVVLARHSGREDTGGGLFDDDPDLPFDDPTAGLWIYNQHGLLDPLLIEGMIINVNGQGRTIASIDEQAWLDINARGQMPITMRFTDGSTGLFVVSVPEPGAASLVMIIILAYAAMRRRAPISGADALEVHGLKSSSRLR